ncbi:MAG: SH3 domain-containing protein [Caldilineaceae bacterium]|nr:SH3 domain-containing protein [Caldilineaceae bacterium]
MAVAHPTAAWPYLACTHAGLWQLCAPSDADANFAAEQSGCDWWRRADVRPGGAAATAIPTAPEETPTPEVTATFTPTPPPGSVLAVGQPARVTAPAGLNLRDNATSSGRLILQLGTGVLVNIVEGPVSAEDFTWWKLDDRQGNIGWAADGDGETEWLSPQLGDPQPVNRSPRVGDRISVTTDPGQQLSIRAIPGTDGPLVTRANPGQEFTVLAGPQTANGFVWYQIRSDDGGVEGWAAEGDANKRWLSPFE